MLLDWADAALSLNLAFWQFLSWKKLQNSWKEPRPSAERARTVLLGIFWHSSH
jgi:hypothetical protein